jgi:hypothetical protein
MTYDLDPTKWGRAGWTIFLSAALAFPDDPSQQDKDRLAEFYANYGKGLPCSLCRRHYIDRLATSPPNVTSRKALVLWAISFHNSVNISLGKPVVEPRDAIQHWTNQLGVALMVPGFEDIAPQSPVLLIGIGALVLFWFLNKRKTNK